MKVLTRTTATIISVILAGIVFWTLYRKDRFIEEKANAVEENNYTVKLSAYKYIIELLIGYFIIGLIIMTGYISLNFQAPRCYFGVFFIAMGIILCLIQLIRIFYLFPKTFIKLENNIFTYFNGYKTVIDVHLDDILEVRKPNMGRQIGYYLKIITKNNQSLLLNLYFFKNPHYIYTTLISNRR